MAWHARISASGMKRVLKCPGSVALAESMPAHLRRGSSEAARLGTAAHGLAEFLLKRLLDQGLVEVYDMVGGAVTLDEHEDATVHSPGEEVPPARWTYPIDDDMCAAVTVYLEVVRNEMSELDCPDTFVERSFTLDWLRPDLGGTSDFTAHEFMGALVVIDYKHGQGVAVDVDDNEQMLTYALGMAQEVDWLFDRLVCIIVQPRCPHAEGSVRRWETTKERLERFRDEVAEGYDAAHAAGEELRRQKEGADLGYDWEERFLRVGTHCTFCDAAGPTCRAQVRSVQEMAKFDFDDVMEDEGQLTQALPAEEDHDFAERLGAVLDWVPALDRFIKAAKALGFAHAISGKEVPGHKLIEGRANRKLIVDEKTLLARAAEKGIKPDRLFEPPKLKSPAQLEKVGPDMKRLVNGVPNPKFGEGDEPAWLVEPVAAKGKGSLSLVPLSNPKPAVTVDPNADFDGVMEDEDE